jgi:menaquinone-dependent protoporphyrinogen oxidase
MSSSVLVAYASKYGSTREVAEAIAETLRSGGIAVSFEKAREVKTLAGCSAVVLGAPIYIGAWHKDALNFLSRHRQELQNLPVAIFALGPTHDDEQERQESKAMLDKELAKFPWLAPVAVEMFGGKFDPAKLRFPDSLLVSLPASPIHNAPPSDVRDWTAIRTWATSLVTKLQPAVA